MTIKLVDSFAATKYLIHCKHLNESNVKMGKTRIALLILRFVVILIHSRNRLLSTFYTPHLELGPEGELPVFGALL